MFEHEQVVTIKESLRKLKHKPLAIVIGAAATLLIAVTFLTDPNASLPTNPPVEAEPVVTIGTVPEPTTTIEATTTTAQATWPKPVIVAEPVVDEPEPTIGYVVEDPDHAEAPQAPSDCPIEADFPDYAVEAAIAICWAFPPAAWQDAITVARCESGLRPWATNGSSLGLFQLNGHSSMFIGLGWSPDDWSNPYANAEVAAHLSMDGTRWGPWVCKP